MKKIKNLGSKLSSTGRKQSWGQFLCPFCNKIVERLLGNGLKQQSCGCQKDIFISKKNIINKNGIKHSQRYTRLYRIWNNMKQRCNNLNHKSYKNYGGRGITVYDEWIMFIPFMKWALNNGYADNLTIDRINNDGNYEPDNCQFLTSKENNRKKSTTILTMKLANEIRDLYSTGNFYQRELAEKYGVSNRHISDIVNNKRWGNI